MAEADMIWARLEAFLSLLKTALSCSWRGSDPMLLFAWYLKDRRSPEEAEICGTAG